ncbi:MAG: PAS domain S-box protein [Chloroflexi bacterium]|nr:PAS domain S-box protein [Chloroflexota bacterium]
MVKLKTSPPPQFYDHLWQSLAEGFLILDRHGDVVAANEPAARILGYESDELAGYSYRLFWPEEMPSPAEWSLDGNQSHSAEIRRQDGRFTPVNLALFPLNAAGAGHKLVVLGSPNQAQHVNDALSHTQRLAGIGTLMAGVAHELVTPISIIANTCSNVMLEIEDDALRTEDLARYIKMIEQSVWRCTRIVDVLRHYAVNDTPQMAVTSLKAVIEDALTLVRHQFRGEFYVEVEVDLDPGLKSALCDHNRMTQVMVNLLINARDAMQPDGGTIQIRAWEMPPTTAAPPVAQKTFSNGSSAVTEYAISVQDTGMGIAPKIMDKIFNPFFTTKPSGKGTGLGLYLARQIVEQHNGRIWAKNNPDDGATFTVVIPRQQ